MQKPFIKPVIFHTFQSPALEMIENHENPRNPRKNNGTSEFHDFLSLGRAETFINVTKYAIPEFTENS